MPPTPGSVTDERRTGEWRRFAAFIGVVLAVAAGLLVLRTVTDLGTGPGPTGDATTQTVSSTQPIDGTGTPSATGTPSVTSTTVPSPTLTTSPPTPVATAPSLTTGTVVLLAVVVLVLAGVVLGLVVLRRRARPGARRVEPHVPAETPATEVSPDRPRASLGTPDVLILTEAATEGDTRLHERVKGAGDAVFANLQLACSFYPTEEWVFRSARLRVVLAREDGRAAPAPIAYSLLPLSDRDGTAREQSVEIGADMKFVSVKGGERSTIAGHEFVRGYGLQESVSYWEFTATQNRPLEGSFLLWLIARAPKDSDLVVRSDLTVWVAPTRRRTRRPSPPVAGTGDVALLLGLTHGPPYTARLLEPPQAPRRDPWLVDVR